MLDHTYVVVDVETTGLDPASDQIIEIAAIRLEKGQLAGQWHTLVNPGRPIPPFIENLTGISNAMVQGAPPLTAVLPAFLDFLGEAIPVGHNGSFDLAFLYRALGSASWHRPLLDTLALSRILYPCLPSYRLEYLTQKFSLEAGEHHRALGDALATARLLHTLWQATLALDKGLLAGLLKLAPPGLQPWFQAALATAPVAAVPVEVAASGIFAPEEAPATAPPEPPAFCPDDIASLLEPGGLLAGQLPGYEYRPQQADILRNVAAALRDDKCLLVEAGTGTGKSLAYLLPAIYWACSQGKRVAIATHTISLQEQLWHKDLPFLKDILPFPFKAALVKGRNNYLCRRKLRDFLLTPPPGEQERHFLLRVLCWLEQTAGGDWSEMKLSPEEEGLKFALTADKDTCAGNACPYNDTCFVNAARREAETAAILVLNHSLLLSDTRLNNQVLPDYPYLIIDEAHHLEEAATEHLGTSVRQASCDIFLQRLGRREHSFSFLGRAWALARRLSGEAGSLLPLLEDIEETAARVSGEWRDFWAALAQLSAAALWEQGNSTLRLTGHLKETPAWDSLLVTFGRLEAVLEGLSSRLGRLAELLYTTGAEEMAADAVNFGNICAQYSHDLGGILDADPGTSVSWLETNNAGQYTLHVAPLEIGPLLADLLFARKRAVILTSATMTVNNDFAFYQQQVGLAGLPAERLATCQVASPFDYRTQALVCTVRGLPNPGQMNDSAYAEAIVPVIARVLPAVGGRTLVLCTSHRLLRDIYNLLVNAPETTDYSILAQGIDGGRSQLLEEFKHIPRAVLLGASSYWEGIDLPGELLRCVIIPRLPFPSPGLPVLAARMEHLAGRGENPFTALSLPLAVIRFRQGFGRLIRSSTDRGALVVLDQRLLSQRYGRYFLQSLPSVTTVAVTPTELPSRLTAWFNPPVCL